MVAPGGGARRQYGIWRFPLAVPLPATGFCLIDDGDVDGTVSGVMAGKAIGDSYAAVVGSVGTCGSSGRSFVGAVTGRGCWGGGLEHRARSVFGSFRRGA